MFRFERGLRPRNPHSGGGSEGGQRPPPSPLVGIYAEPRFLPCGDQALSVELGDDINREVNARVLALEYLIQQRQLAGVTETVPSYRSLLVYYDALTVGWSELTRTLRA